MTLPALTWPDDDAEIAPASKGKGAVQPAHTREQVRDISVLVYAKRLGKADAASLLEKIGPDKFRAHAASYDPLTRAYLEALEPRMKKT